MWDRSTVWGMLRNPAYHGQAAYGKTKVSDKHGQADAHDPRSRRAPRPPPDPAWMSPVEQWTFIPVAPLVTEPGICARTGASFASNAHFAKRNTKKPTLLQGHPRLPRVRLRLLPLLDPHDETSVIYYYRCIGSDNYRHIGGRVCHSRPIRADELEPLVWHEVRTAARGPPPPSAPRSTAG